MNITRLQPDDYHFGWVCALPCELKAAKRMLDEEHGDILLDLHDENLYTLDRVGNHNVVLVCLPAGRIGTNQAASVVSQMRITFPCLRYASMIGIGGGVPGTAADIRLGDVVVSVPHIGRGGGGPVRFREEDAERLR